MSVFYTDHCFNVNWGCGGSVVSNDILRLHVGAQVVSGRASSVEHFLHACSLTVMIPADMEQTKDHSLVN